MEMVPAHVGALQGHSVRVDRPRMQMIVRLNHQIIPVMVLVLKTTHVKGQHVMEPTLVIRISVLRRDVRQKQLYTMIVPRASQPR